MIAGDLALGQWAPKSVDPSNSKYLDGLRRHLDETDAKACVRRLERDYELHLQYSPCPYKRGLYHIEFVVDLDETDREVLQAYIDGYHPIDIQNNIRAGKRNPESRMKYLRTATGATSRDQILALAVYFGIIFPTVLVETGKYA